MYVDRCVMYVYILKKVNHLMISKKGMAFLAICCSCLSKTRCTPSPASPTRKVRFWKRCISNKSHRSPLKVIIHTFCFRYYESLLLNSHNSDPIDFWESCFCIHQKWHHKFRKVHQYDTLHRQENCRYD